MTAISVDTYVTVLFPFDRELRRHAPGLEEELASLPFEVTEQLADLMDIREHHVSARVVLVDGRSPDTYSPLGLSTDQVRQRLHAVRAGAVLHLSAYIDADVPIERAFPVSDGTEWVADQQQLEILYRQEAIRSMHGVDAMLALALNIARPGVFDIGPTFSSDGRLVEHSDAIVSNLPMAARSAHGNGWPNFDPLPLVDVWEWVRSRDYLNCMGETRVERAFNAYTRLFGDVSRGVGSEDLFWALVGLEALYCDGTAGSMSQVVSRSQMLLGPHASLKKDFNRAYAMRSAFIHGGLPFPGLYCLSDGTKAFEDFVHRTGEASATAGALLVASLRELIKRRWHDVWFLTEIKGSGGVSEGV